MFVFYSDTPRECTGTRKKLYCFLRKMAEATGSKLTAQEKGKTIFLDVFRRADKNDDGALSWAEFTSFFSDGILSTDDLKKLFNDIDTHNTNNLDTSELCEFFLKEAGPFSKVFEGLEDMNAAVSEALFESSKAYSNQSFIGKFITRFLLKEVLGQLASLEHHVDVAVDKIDEMENDERPEVVQAEMTNLNTSGGRMRRKQANFSQQTSVDAGAVRNVLSQEVNRLADLISRLENKVKFDVVEEEETNIELNEMVLIVSRKFNVSDKNLTAFRSNLKAYIGATSLQNGCRHLSVRSFSGTSTFILYEIWSNSEDLHRHYSGQTSKTFMHSNIDNLEQPEEYSKMAIPASWWAGTSD